MRLNTFLDEVKTNQLKHVHLNHGNRVQDGSSLLGMGLPGRGLKFSEGWMCPIS